MTSSQSYANRDLIHERVYRLIMFRSDLTDIKELKEGLSSQALSGTLPISVRLLTSDSKRRIDSYLSDVRETDLPPARSTECQSAAQPYSRRRCGRCQGESGTQFKGVIFPFFRYDFVKDHKGMR